jgi:hypothetical protein
MVTFNALMVRSETMPDLAKAQALVDWIYWSQTDINARQIARSYVYRLHHQREHRVLTVANQPNAHRGHMVVASMAQTAKSDLLNQLAMVTSQSKAAFSLAGCIYEGTVCADEGTCVDSACVCKADREGSYCESRKSTLTLLSDVES